MTSVVGNWFEVDAFAQLGVKYTAPCQGYLNMWAVWNDLHGFGQVSCMDREANSAYVKRRAPGSVPVAAEPAEPETPAPIVPTEESAVPPAPTFTEAPAAEAPAPAKRRSRGGRKPKVVETVAEAVVAPVAAPVTEPAADTAPPAEAASKAAKPARKPRAPRTPRRKKTETKAGA